MVDHPTDQALIDFVTGSLPQAELPAFEEHVSRCETCAERLEREASFELALEDVAGLSPAAPAAVLRPRRWRRGVMPVLAAALAAAATWAILARRSPTAEASGPIPDVICADGPEQDACIADAHRHGLFVAYPARAGAPMLDRQPPGDQR